MAYRSIPLPSGDRKIIPVSVVRKPRKREMSAKEALRSQVKSMLLSVDYAFQLVNQLKGEREGKFTPSEEDAIKALGNTRIELRNATSFLTSGS